MALFHTDTSGKIDAVNPVDDDDDANLGLKARYTFTKNNNMVDMMGPTIFFQDRLIFNGVQRGVYDTCRYRAKGLAGNS